MIEFALVSALLMTLLFGAVDFGRAIFDYNSVAQGAQLATRFALVNASTYCISSSDSSSVDKCKPPELAAFETAITNYTVSRTPGATAMTFAFAFPSTSDCTVSTQPTSYQNLSPLCEITVTASVPFSFTFFSVGTIVIHSASTQIFTN